MLDNLQPRKATTNARSLATGVCFWMLLLLTACCLWPGISGPFVFDDFPNLENLRLLGGRVDRNSVGQYLFSFIDNPGRPLAALSFLIEDATWPTYPAAFKRNNILFHLVAGALIFWLSWLLAKLRRPVGNAAALVALACAAMWLLHPMQLSATMLVVQRMNILSTIFMLAGLLVYLKFLGLARVPELARVAAAGAALGVFGMLAVLCKENGALIFAYAAALNVTLLRDRLLGLHPFNRSLLLWGVAAPILLMAVLAVVNWDSILLAYPGRDFTLGQRLLTETRILFEYLGMIVLPRLGGQGIFHDDYLVSMSLFNPLSTAFAVLGILVLLVSAVMLRRRHPLYSFAVLWFFAGHLIESTVVGLELYFEHRNYLPMVGPLFAMASLAFSVANRYRNAVLVIVSVWLCTAALLTFYNAGIWGDRGKLALVWAQQSPRSVRAVQTLAVYYADTRNVAEARRTLDAGIKRLPARAELQMQRILLDCSDRGLRAGQWQQVVDLATYSRYSRTIPDVVSSFVREAVGNRCHRTLSINEVRQLIGVLLANPNFGSDNDTRGYLHYELSRLAFSEHDLDELMRQLDLSNQFRPNPLVPREQAIYLLTAGLPDHALEYLDRSDNTPQPRFKAWLIDIKSKNEPLRRSAIEMQAALRRNQKL